MAKQRSTGLLNCKKVYELSQGSFADFRKFENKLPFSMDQAENFVDSFILDVIRGNFYHMHNRIFYFQIPKILLKEASVELKDLENDLSIRGYALINSYSSGEFLMAKADDTILFPEIFKKK